MKSRVVRILISLQHSLYSGNLVFLDLYLCMVFFLLYLSGCTSLQDLQGISNPPCNYSLQVCGNLRIPYPFGILSTGCGLPEYRISCKLNASYGDGELAFLQIGTPSTPELQVLSFSTNNIVVNSTDFKAMPSPLNCNTPNSYGHANLELVKDGPFILSTNNWFVVMGCNSEGSCIADTVDNKSSTIACTTSCYNQFDMEFCNDYACCINAIPPGSFSLKLQGRGIDYKDFPGVCGFSTAFSPPNYNIPDKQKGVFGAGQYGLSISWALQSLDPEQNCNTAKQRPDYACRDTAECIYDNDIHGYTCNCTQGYRGDGYKAGIGCEDIDECEEHPDVCERPPLGICTNTVGSYKCNCAGGAGSGQPGTCPMINHNRNLVLPVILGGFAGAAGLAVIFVATCISRRAYRKRQEREENFRRIGGDQLKSFLFSERELIKATNGFSDDHVLGEGGFGKVYWGKVTTEQGGTIKVAIKRAKPKAVEEQIAQMQSFVKEILLLSKTVHKNVVRLLGCCVETSVPLLVYEFVENGTLRDYLTHTRNQAVITIRKKTAVSNCSLWAWRLHIAMETAEALNYLHTMTEPIFHLDMKSANILIDREYNPKVADFGLSCFLTSDATHLTNQLPAGTFGYVDPEYYQSLRITDKCDVYSFGVIMLELISSWPASQGPGAVLAHHFRTVVDIRKEIRQHLRVMPSFVDSRLGCDEDVLASIVDVAELAQRCVAVKGSERPSMEEVVGELRRIQEKNAGKLSYRRSVHADETKELFRAGNSNSTEGDDWISSDQSPSATSPLFGAAPCILSDDPCNSFYIESA